MSRAPRYSEEEHWALQEAVKKLGPNWRKDMVGLKQAYDQILKTKFNNKRSNGETFPNREGTALKAHWDQLTKKGPDNYPWTEEEVERLRELHAKFRSDFSAIRYELGTGRSISAIKKKIREIMDENLMSPYSPVMSLSTSLTKPLSRAQRVQPVTQQPEEEDTGRVEQLETKFEEFRQEFENVQTELKEVKEALQGLLQVMNDAHKPQNPQ